MINKMEQEEKVTRFDKWKGISVERHTELITKKMVMFSILKVCF
jgi:hypothetical protein